MHKPDLLWLAFIDCSKAYQQKAKEGKPKVKELQLKNVTPTKEEAEKSLANLDKLLIYLVGIQNRNLHSIYL